MPTYEFRCNACGKVFEEESSLAEHERKMREHAVQCPVCGSGSVRAQISAFEVQTSHKS